MVLVVGTLEVGLKRPPLFSHLQTRFPGLDVIRGGGIHIVHPKPGDSDVLILFN